MKRFWSILLLMVCGCAHGAPYVWVDQLAMKDPPPTIEIGDKISVQVKEQATLSGEFLVRANGAYLQPVYGEIIVAGHSPRDAAKTIATALNGIVVSPLVAVSVSEPRLLSVKAVGEVRSPGAFELKTPEGVLEVIARAGGLTEFAGSSQIYVLRTHPQQMRIRFSYDELIGADPASIAFKVRHGDVVVVE